MPHKRMPRRGDMNSRERVSRALARAPVDRIPFDCWISKGAIRNLEKFTSTPYTELLDEWDVDFRYIPGPRYIGPPLPADRDIWGVYRTAMELALPYGTETYEEILESPLANARTVADIDKYSGWPSPAHFDYSVIPAQCEAIRARGRVVVFMGDRLNRIAQLKPAMYLRGMENILADMVLHPDIAQAIFRKIRTFYREYLQRILAAARGGIDIVLTGDDFGAQQGPLVSAELWRRCLQPGFQEYLALVRQHGASSMHHTCGSVVELIPDMIACGLNILQSLQPDTPHMALESLLRQFGGRLCFQGGISVQHMLPRGTPTKIRREVARIAALVRGRGGYIFCTAHNIQADTPPANILALMQAYRLEGRTRR